MTYTKMLVAFIATTMLASCSKTDKKDSAPITPSTDKLVGVWKIIAVTADRPVYHWNTTELVTDLWDREKDCTKDDLLIFKSDGTYQHDEGATKCNASSPQVSGTGKWKKSGNELTSTEDGTDYKYTIDKLNDSSLAMTGQRFYIISDDTTFYNATMIFSRQ